MLHWTLSLAATIAIGMLWAGYAAAADVTSRSFHLEGHGDPHFYFFSYDEQGRITARDDVATPHISWRDGVSQAPLRVLAIAHQVHGRWPIEIQQRFGFRTTTIYAYDGQRLGAPPAGRGKGMFGQRGADVEARLLQAMNEPIDVVVSELPVSALGEAVQVRLEKLIRQGTGYVGPREGLNIQGLASDRQAARAIAESALPLEGLRLLGSRFQDAAEAADELMMAYIGEGVGRVVDMHEYPRDSDPPDPARLQYPTLPSMEHEAWCATLGRAVLWAAERVPARSAASVTWPNAPLPWEQLPRELVPSEPDEDADWRIRIWDADGRLRHDSEGRHVPRLPTGRYFVGLQRKGPGDDRDWSLGTVEVRSPMTIAEIELDERFKRVGERIRARVRLSDEPPAGSTLRMEVIDNHGRHVNRELQPATVDATFAGDLSESLHLYNYVNVQLRDVDGRLMAEDRRGFFVEQRHVAHDDLNWIAWEGGAGFHPRTRPFLHEFARLGMRGIVTGNSPGPIEAGAIENVQSVIYAYRHSGRVDENNILHPCLSNPGFRSQALRQIQESVDAFGRYSPLFYYLGDDVGYVAMHADACWSPFCVEAFADWAKDRHEVIDRINLSWDTAIEAFDQIEPIRRADVLSPPEGRSEAGSLAHWLDHHRFTDAKVAGWWRELAGAIAEIAPEVPANMGSSIVGWPWPGSGFDFWQLAADKDLVFQYPNPWVHEIFRSARAPQALHGTWYGGYGLYNYRPYYDQEFFPWWSVLRGINLHGLYYGGQSARSSWFAERLLAPDLSPLDGFERTLENLKELQAGPAKLLLNARRANDGMAMVYCSNSQHATIVFSDGLPRRPEWQGQMTASHSYLYMQSWEGTYYLLRDLGYSPDVIPAAALADAEALREHRVIVLPLTLVLDEAQADALRQFVRDGGKLIADTMPGLFDGTARTDHGGMLADVFGVHRDGGRDGANIALDGLHTADAMALGHWAVDGATVQAGADYRVRSDGGSVALMSHRYGDGRAVLLNILTRDYQIARVEGTEMPLRDQVAALLASVGLEPAVDIEVSSRGRDAPHRAQVTEVARYDLDGGHYVALLRHHKLRPDDVIYMADLRPKPVWITFDHEAHIYDVRRGMYRGFSDRVETVLYPARTALYALLPYEVRDLILQASAETTSFLVEGEIQAGDVDAEPVAHVLHVRVFEPDGQERRELRRNIVAESGRFSERFFVGYAAEQGQWYVTVRDVASGIQRRIVVGLNPRQQPGQ